MKKLLIIILLTISGLSDDLKEPIKIVYNSGTEPLKFTNEQNQADGMLIDIWKLWSTKTNQKIEFIEASWDDTLLMVKNGQADIHGGLYYTEDRAKYLDYTEQYLYKNKTYFFHHKSIKNIKNNKEIFPFVIGIGNGYPGLFMKENYPEAIVKQFSSNRTAINAIKDGKIKVFLNSLPTFVFALKVNGLNANDFKYIENSPVYSKQYFGAVQKGNTELLNIVNEGFKQISNEELKEIEYRWTKNIDDKYFHNHDVSTISFTPDEKKYISNNPIVKVASNPAWPPFSFINNDTNEPDGISADYLKLLSSKIGINFKYIKSSSWDDSIKMIKNKDVDIFGVIKQTQQRDKYLNFTDTYISFPMVAVTKHNISFVNSIEDIQDRRFAMIRNFSSTEYLTSNYQNLNIVLYNDAKECMDEVAKGSADVFIGSLGTVSYLLKQEEYINLKIAGKIGIESSWGIGIRNDIKPELLSILNKGLKSISDKDKNRILNKWTQIEFDSKVDYTLLYQVITVFILFLLGTVYWARKLAIAKQNANESREFANSVINAQESFVITSDGKCLRTTNQAFLDFFEVENIYMFTKKFGNCVCDTFDTTASKEYIQKNINGVKWIDYVYNSPTEIHKAIILKDDKKYTFTITADRFLFKGEMLSVSVLTNITTLEDIKNKIHEMHIHTKDSIEFASVIQSALIPDYNLFKKFFDDSLVLWTPKDVVGGDIYLIEELRDGDECLLMVIDCTGHGVPGAFITMFVKAIERQIILHINNNKDMDVSPAWVLSYFNKNMKKLLKQESKDSVSNAGFDGQVIYYNKSTNIIKTASARNEIFYIKDDELNTIKPDKHSVGYRDSNSEYEFKDTTINIDKEMTFYISSDGYWDQIGGTKELSFGKRRLKKVLIDNYKESMADQKEILINTLYEYQDDSERLDDVTFVGLKISPQSISINNKPIISFDGIVSQDKIDDIVEEIEAKFLQINGGQKIISKISYISIEILQNILNYNVSLKSSKFTINYDSEKQKYYVTGINSLNFESVEKLSKKLDYISSLDSKELRGYYKELLKTANDKHDGGAGIGLVDIIKKSSEKLEYSIIKENDIYVYSIKLYI